MQNDFAEAARNWLGVRWVHQGRNRNGIDCVGLLIVSAAEIGIEVPDLKGYRRSPQPEVFLEHIRANSDPIESPVPGSFGIFRDGLQPCHVGVFAELHNHTSLIHAYAGAGKVIEEIFAHHWLDRLIEIRSIKGLQ